MRLLQSTEKPDLNGGQYYEYIAVMLCEKECS